MNNLPNHRILILVPHADDEVVGFMAAAERARAEGAEIFALYLTTGVVGRDVMWPWQRHLYEKRVAVRRAEGECVAAAMGLTPCGWLPYDARDLWRHIPILYQTVLAVIEAHRIDTVWVPAYEGGNADHDVANAIGQSIRSRCRVFEFAEYNWKDQSTQAQIFPDVQGDEVVLVLSREEKIGKRKLLALYASEKGNLSSIGADRECYRPLPERSYALPPHKGRLWYTRFQWVPFKHPGVDRTDPAQVSAAIEAFLAAEKNALRESARPTVQEQIKAHHGIDG